MHTIKRTHTGFQFPAGIEAIQHAVMVFGFLIRPNETLRVGTFALRIERHGSNDKVAQVAEELYALEKSVLRAQSTIAPEVWDALMEFCVDHYAHFNGLPVEFVFEHDGREETAIGIELSEEEFDVDRQALRRNIGEARKVWEELGDVPVNGEMEIDEPFRHFPVGTSVYDIWQWIESTHKDVSVAIDLARCA